MYKGGCGSVSFGQLTGHQSENEFETDLVTQMGGACVAARWTVVVVVVVG